MAGVTHKSEGNHKPVNGHLSLVICAAYVIHSHS
jgi:hypothetical protein